MGRGAPPALQHPSLPSTSMLPLGGGKRFPCEFTTSFLFWSHYGLCHGVLPTGKAWPPNAGSDGEAAGAAAAPSWLGTTGSLWRQFSLTLPCTNHRIIRFKAYLWLLVINYFYIQSIVIMLSFVSFSQYAGCCLQLPAHSPEHEYEAFAVPSWWYTA